MMETGTLPRPYEPTVREKWLSKRFCDDADALENALAEKGAVGALRQLALRGYHYAPANLREAGVDAYVRGVVDGLRRVSILLITGGSQGIA